MSGRKVFEYDLSLFQDCAEATIKETNAACQFLFQQHQKHYGRLPHSSEQEALIRFQRFLDSVIFVHHHNGKSTTHQHRHQVTLNQFSDYTHEELPLHAVNFYSSSTIPSSTYTDALQEGDEQDHQPQLQQDVGVNGLENQPQILHTPKIQRDDYDSNANNSHNSNSNYSNNVGPIWVSASTLPWITSHLMNLQVSSLRKDIITSLIEGEYSFSFQSDPWHQNWKQYLNWATTDNPDGVPIVHPSSDQGICGSCWAFSAIGSLEANIARHTAFSNYWSWMDKGSNKSFSSVSYTQQQIRQDAILLAQNAERNTIQSTVLSVQELVDCDTKFDQGCTGGNPLFAFPFIRTYGLVSQLSYPYYGKESKHCHRHLISHPIATVETWGLLIPKSEDNMELVLRTLGPIAVGLDGDDPSFLSYKGGIFDSDQCNKQHPNHAMLIVGFGEVHDDDTGEIVQYWICRNSWGSAWGENGFVRMRRKGKGSSGVCGIARNPSIALGGSLVDETGHVNGWRLNVEKNVPLSIAQSLTVDQISETSNLTYDGFLCRMKNCGLQHEMYTFNIFVCVLILCAMTTVLIRWQRRKFGKDLATHALLGVDKAVSNTDTTSPFSPVTLDRISFRDCGSTYGAV